MMIVISKSLLVVFVIFVSELHTNYVLILVIIILCVLIANELLHKSTHRKDTNTDSDKHKNSLIDADSDKSENSILYASPEEFFAGELKYDLETIYDNVLGDDYYCSSEVEVNFADGIFEINSRMPNKNEISRVKEVYYLKNGEEREKIWSERDFQKIYENALYNICLKSIEKLFSYVFINEADIDEGDGERKEDNQMRTVAIQSILFNGTVTDYSPTTGQLETKTIMSIFVKREQFENIDLNHVDPKACFKALKGVSAAKLYNLSPVTPVLTFDKNDHRFIEAENVEVTSGTNLASMDWQDFEQLVRELFEAEFSKNGGEVKVTQASRDGGVDAIAFDPDPIRGGKIIIQAKRYTNVVPVSAVRDLYGTVINEGANSGILITTADYGSDSYDFAKDKPIKLLNGGHLLTLLERNGKNGYINLQEAKRLNTDE